MKKNVRLLVLFLLLASIAASCGGGGGAAPPAGDSSVRLSGTVAAGAPIVSLVYLKDSAGNILGPVQPSADGTFSFDVKGLTPPFYLRAEGAVVNTSYTLYSAAAGAGTANINPLTTIGMAAAAGVNDPAAVYNNPLTAPVTAQSLGQASQDIQSMLQLQLDEYNANANPFTASFTADHTGLDAVLDVVSVNTNTLTGLVEMTSRMTDSVMAAAYLGNLAAPTISLTVSNVTSTLKMKDVQDIQTMFSNLTTALNKGASGTLQVADLAPFFATSYGTNDGLSSSQTMSAWVSDFNWWSKAYAKMIISVEPAVTPGDYAVQARSYFTDGSYYDLWPTGVIVTNEAGSWKLKGNGYYSAVPISVETHKWVYSNGTSTTLTGIDFYMKDPTGKFNTNATIAGPGLGGGITMIPSGGQFVFSSPTVSNRAEFYPMSDADIDLIPDNADYTITFNGTTTMMMPGPLPGDPPITVSMPISETRKVKIPKRPFKTTEFADIFPVLSAPTTHTLADANIGGDFAFTYTKPTAYATIWITTGMEYHDGGGHNGRADDVQARMDLNTITISTTAPTGWTPTNARFMLNATDQYRRSPYIWWDFE